MTTKAADQALAFLHAQKEEPRGDAQATEGAASSASPPLGLNVHQRKLRVMAKCAALTLDSDYNGQTKDGRPIRFKYLSIQAVSNQLRKFCVEEGLDINLSVTDGSLVVMLVNVEEPTDIIVSTWPLVPTDKAWAYTTKYALVRTFLIGDGEENDEADMANHSASTVTAEVKRVFAPTSSPQASQPATAPKQRPDKRAVGRNCPECGTGELMMVSWPGKAPSHVECSEWRTCKYRAPVEAADRRLPELTGVGAAVSAEADRTPLEAYEDHDGSIPF